MEKLHKHTQELLMLTNENYKREQSIVRIKDEVKKKNNMDEFKELLSRFDVFSQIETIELLRNDYLPTI